MIIALLCFALRFDRLVDRQQSFFVRLRDQAGHAVLGVAAVDALGFKDVGKGNAARDDDLGRAGVVLARSSH